MNLPFLRRYGHRQSTLTYIEIQTYTVKKIVNDINTQIGCIDGFEMTTRYLKMEDIKVIFKKMLKEHELSIVQNNQEMFHKQEQSTPALISGNSSLTNRRLDSLSKETNDQKESSEFSKNEYDNKFKNLGNKVRKLEEKINLMKEYVLQKSKQSWVKRMRNWSTRSIAPGKITYDLKE